MQTRDVVVVGASMGGIDALSRLAAHLPADLAASVFVVQHTSVESPASLGRILDHAGPLKAAIAETGMPIEHGRVYVAPPDRHLILTAAGIAVLRGPRENRHRPAIDPLFRTAAVNYGGRVIGVILTGLFWDGASGLRAVAACGGAALVQSPEDAAHAEMPSHALEAVPSARSLPIAELASAIADLTREAAPPTPEIPGALRMEARLTERAMMNEDWHQLRGRPTDFTCPECMGAIQEIEEGGEPRYRCRVGHAYTALDLVLEKARATEDSLWVALQTLDERASMLENMARDDREKGRIAGVESLERRAAETRRHADRIREVLNELPA